MNQLYLEDINDHDGVNYNNFRYLQCISGSCDIYVTRNICNHIPDLAVLIDVYLFDLFENKR
jgi:hypothetical protein